LKTIQLWPNEWSRFDVSQAVKRLAETSNVIVSRSSGSGGWA
jgi:hypothetical protein